MRELTELQDDERALAAARFRVIRAHLERGVPLPRVASKNGVSLRTARRWIKRYRADGLVGLARKGRRDHGASRSLSAEVAKAIEGLALAQPPMALAAIRREVSQWARASNLRAPSYTTVRRVVSRIAAPLLVMGREGETAYRDSFELVLRREATAPNEIWQADHTPLDMVLLRDSAREGRPWLTVITDEFSRAIAGFALSFDAPSALRTSLALRQAIWRKTEPRWVICGIPATLYSDNGSDFTSEHLQHIAADLKIRLVHSTPGKPRGRGKIERFFRTVNQRLLCHLPGYVQRGQRRKGALLTLTQLDAKFRDFLDEYHRERHSETGAAPLVRWRDAGFIPQMPESLEKLDLLLLTVPRSRLIHSDGVHFANFRYLDPVLGAYIGEQVVIRYDPRDIGELRLFHRGRFLCRAICPALAGQTVALKDVVAARTRERRAVREQLRDRRAAVDRLVEFRRGDSTLGSDVTEPVVTRPSAGPKIKRYRNDPT